MTSCRSHHVACVADWSTCSFSFCSTPQCVSSTVVMLLPRIRIASTTSCDTHRCAVVWCPWSFESFFDPVRHIFVGSHQFSAPADKCTSNTWCRFCGHWVEDFFNSISSTLPISKITPLDSFLNTILSLARASRRQILFEPNFTL